MNMAGHSKVLGTAGHIDHGKSALVLALTGTDPDRLAEEKKRGITIELGFAKLVLPDGSTMGVVDVPGHERFVRQMIAGSTGIDVALLCIAADDGIMPQTREHEAVLELLGVPSMVVALTKCDKVDEEWTDFVKSEVASWLETTPYAGAPIVETSAVTGQGIDELKEAIARTAAKTAVTHESAIARMPIDRSFSIKGAGTVVTGTLWSGTVSLGDELEVLPGKKRVRVRSIQEHDEDRDEAKAGNRVALNLPAVTPDEVRPGGFLATPGAIEPTDRFDAWFTYLRPGNDRRPLESGVRVRVAHGTREVFGRVLLMNGRETLGQRQSDFVQIRLEEELALSWTDRFVVRSESPVEVIGGGAVLACHPRRRTTVTTDGMRYLEALRAHDRDAVVRGVIVLSDGPLTLDEVAKRTGVEREECMRILDEEVEQRHLRMLDTPREAYFVKPQAVQSAVGSLENALLRYHVENPESIGLTPQELAERTGLRVGEDVFSALLTVACKQGKASFSDGLASHPKAGAAARHAADELARNVSEELAREGAAPLLANDLAKKLGCDVDALYAAFVALDRAGAIVRVGPQMAFDAQVFDGMKDSCVALIEKQGQATMAELKDAMGTTRRYAVPVIEYLDDHGVTRREGDVRVLA
jgi:selenocysteine-specific elongation factor